MDPRLSGFDRKDGGKGCGSGERAGRAALQVPGERRRQGQRADHQEAEADDRQVGGPLDCKHSLYHTLHASSPCPASVLQFAPPRRERLARGPTFQTHTHMDIEWRAGGRFAAQACSHPLHRSLTVVCCGLHALHLLPSGALRPGLQWEGRRRQNTG